MAKYFYDTEFIEGIHKPILGKHRHFIDLISIGIVAEDGREFSAISREYHYKDASPWVQENVITPLYISTVHGDARNHCDVHNFHLHYGKSNKEIADEIVRFVNPVSSFAGYQFDNKAIVEKRLSENILDKEFKEHNVALIDGRYYVQPDLYGYFADYDHVLLSSLFGTMMDLPKGFPMYTIDLKQMLDGKVRTFCGRRSGHTEREYAWARIQEMKEYPKQDKTKTHVAIEDARWNKQLYEFLMA